MTPRQIIENTLDHEGGYVNHPEDPGGHTNFGITLAFLKRVRPGATVDDLKALTRDEAADIYFETIYSKRRIDELPVVVRDIYFDMIVNHGLRNAGRILQRGIIDAGQAVSVDGLVGSKTIAAAIQANQNDPAALRLAVIDRRQEFYDRIVMNKPSMWVFKDGWKNRVDSFRVA